MASLSVTIDATGTHVPAFSTVYTGVQDIFRGIYGTDIYLGADSQDGQLAAALAMMISDCNNATAAAVANFSPLTAVGTALSSMVKLNGLQREPETYSTAAVVVNGAVGTTIRRGIVADAAGVAWHLPDTTIIGVSGNVTVLATCTLPGPITAGPSTLTRIQTPVTGWQTVSNPAAATPGKDAESDGALRLRQTKSTGQPALTLLAAILAAVRNVPGVTTAQAYSNDTTTTDSNGVPAKSIAIVASGGDPVAIATAIMNKKGPGPATVGNVSETIQNSVGNFETISYTVPTQVPINVNITLKALTGFTSAIRDEVVASLVASQANNNAGDDVEWASLFPAALLILDTVAQAAFVNGFGQPVVQSDAQSYSITSLMIRRGSIAFAQSDVGINYNELATMSPTDIVVTVI